MPTYEYRCDNCAKNFDVVQSFHDDPLSECPTCGSPVRKVFGNVGIVFKGSGFYKNDSRSGNGSKKSGAEATATTSDNGSDGSGSSAGGSGGSAESASTATSPSSDSGSSDSSSSKGTTPSTPSTDCPPDR